MKKPIIFASALAVVLAATLLPATASANHTTNWQPAPSHGRHHRAQSIEVWVNETVAVNVPDYQWVQSWTWNWNCFRWEYTWQQVQTGSHVEYRTQSVRKTAYWDEHCRAYVWYDNMGNAHRVDSTPGWR